MDRWLLLSFVISTIMKGHHAQITFATVPKGCTVKSVGDVNGEEKIDCEGATYSRIPFESIPCDTKRINFANNNFTRLTRASFRGLQQLEEIVLTGNRIAYIEAETFAGLPNLKTVSLVNNLLSNLDERPFWEGQYSNLMVSVDGNPWFCDEDLKETVEALYKRVSFIGLVCRGGFIRGIRGTIVGREFEDIRDRIENELESWEIALICSGSFGFFVALALIGYGVAMCKQANTGEEYEMQGTRESNRFMDNLERTQSRVSTPEPGAALDPSFQDRRIQMNSEDYYHEGDPKDTGAFQASPVATMDPPKPPPHNTQSGFGAGLSSLVRNRVESPTSPQSPPPRPPPVEGGAMAMNNEDEIHV